MGQTEQENRFECPVCSTPLDREAYISASESLRRKFHEELQREEEEFEKKLRKAVELYHRQVEELRKAHRRSQSNLKNELMNLHHKQVVQLTKYHDEILTGSKRQFHDVVRQIDKNRGAGTPGGTIGQGPSTPTIHSQLPSLPLLLQSIRQSLLKVLKKDKRREQ